MAPSPADGADGPIPGSAWIAAGVESRMTKHYRPSRMNRPETAEELPVFRPRLALRVVNACVALSMSGLAVFLLVAIVLTALRGSLGGETVFGFITAEATAALWLWISVRTLFMKIEVAPKGIRIVNYFSTRLIAWTDVERFQVGAGYYGIEVVLRDGRRVRANAVQKANLATWLGRETRADRVVSRLNAALTAASSSTALA